MAPREETKERGSAAGPRGQSGQRTTGVRSGCGPCLPQTSAPRTRSKNGSGRSLGYFSVEGGRARSARDQEDGGERAGDLRWAWALGSVAKTRLNASVEPHGPLGWCCEVGDVLVLRRLPDARLATQLTGISVWALVRRYPKSGWHAVSRRAELGLRV